MFKNSIKWGHLLMLFFLPLTGITVSLAASQPQVFVDKGPDVQSMPFDFIYTPPFQDYSTNGVFQFGNGLTITGYRFGTSFTPGKGTVDFLVYDGIPSTGTFDFQFHGQAPITGMWIDNYPDGAGEVIVLFGQDNIWYGAVEIDQNVSINPATDYNGHAWFVEFNSPKPINHVQVIGITDIDAFTTATKGLP